jgi:hypothetical protein
MRKFINIINEAAFKQDRRQQPFGRRKTDHPDYKPEDDAVVAAAKEFDAMDKADPERRRQDVTRRARECAEIVREANDPFHLGDDEDRIYYPGEEASDDFDNTDLRGIPYPKADDGMADWDKHAEKSGIHPTIRDFLSATREVVYDYRASDEDHAAIHKVAGEMMQLQLAHAVYGLIMRGHELDHSVEYVANHYGEDPAELKELVVSAFKKMRGDVSSYDDVENREIIHHVGKVIREAVQRINEGKVDTTCENSSCKKTFQVRAADKARGWGKFCSKRCKAVEQTRRTGRGAPKGRSHDDDWHEDAMHAQEAGWDGHKNAF